jgi:hypothetical protein
MVLTIGIVKFESRGVLGGAYRGQQIDRRTLLTHTTVAGKDLGVALCGQLNIADSFSCGVAEGELPPTCPRCLKKDPRFKKVAP